MKAKALYLSRRYFDTETLQKWIKHQNTSSIYWFHVASLGEFEQATVFMNNVRTLDHSAKFVVSFFSPSGYNNASLMNDCYKIYLPKDTYKSMCLLAKAINPKALFILKSEFWINLLRAIDDLKIPRFHLNSSITKNDLIFRFKVFRKLLYKSQGIFTSNQATYDLLSSFDLQNVYLINDPRIEKSINNINEIPAHLSFIKNIPEDIFVFGSVYPTDIELIKYIRNEFPFKTIVVPHELNGKNLDLFKLELGFDTIISSSDLNNKLGKRTLWNKMGDLKYLYAFAKYAYVGGTNKGLHNTVEATVNKIPVFVNKEFVRNKNNNEAVLPFESINQLSNLIRENMDQKEVKEIEEYYIENNTFIEFLKNNLLSEI